MAKQKVETPAQNLEKVEDVLSRTEQYIEENQKSLIIIVLAIILIVGVYLGYNKFYVQSQEKDAQAQMFIAQQYFEKDSFQLAINGDGNYLGFLAIIDDFGVTKAANLAHYYTGISYLKLGKFTEAVEYLKGFDTDDQMLAPIAAGAIGDAYSELGNNNEALSYYLKASKVTNEFTTPIFLMKAGLIYEELGKWEEALGVYEKIESDFRKSAEARYIDKYIQRAKIKLNKA
jgi:tetratricopeptide (TPR) repeat protein